MDWMNRKVAESPYRLAMFGGIIISIVVSTLMAAVQSWFPNFDSEGLEAVDQLLAGPPLVVGVLLFIIVIVSPILDSLLC